jgi:hypothetical protein
LRRGEDRFFQHVLETLLAVLVPVRDPPGQRLVAAMLAPRLSQRFQFDIGRIPPQVAVVLLDRLHLDQRQVQLALAAQSPQRVVVQLADRHRHQLEKVRGADVQFRQFERPKDNLLDRVVRQDLRAEQRDFGRIEPADPVLAQRANRLDLQPEIGDGLLGALSHRVHHAGLSQHVDQQRLAEAVRLGQAPSRPLIFRGRRRFGAEPVPFFHSLSVGCFRRLVQQCVADRSHDRPFHHAVREQFGGQSFDLLALEIALQQIAVGGPDRQVAGQAQVARIGCDPPPLRIRHPFGRMNVDFPKRHDGAFLSGSRAPNATQDPCNVATAPVPIGARNPPK